MNNGFNDFFSALVMVKLFSTLHALNDIPIFFRRRTRLQNDVDSDNLWAFNPEVILISACASGFKKSTELCP